MFRHIFIWIRPALLLFAISLGVMLSSPQAVCAFGLTGDLKLFQTLSGAPRGLESYGGESAGALTSRLKVKHRWGGWSVEGHALFSALGAPSANAGPFSLSPNINQVGEAVPLSYQVIDEGEANAWLRADRLLLTYERGSLRVRLGRQALSFGQGRVFTPLDRVNPFSPASVDREYKPGVDAARLDGFWGVAGEWTLVAAQRGDWSFDHSVFGARARDSFKGWDLSLTGLWVGGDKTLGLSLAGTLHDVGIYSDIAYTWRATQGDLAQADLQRAALLSDAALEPFLRAMVGGEWRWSAWGGGSVLLEVTWLGDGASSSREYLVSATDPRVARGERWLLGRAYASLGVNQALTPLLNASLSCISNLKDPSALIGPALVWSASDEVSVQLGGYAGAGAGLKPSGVLGATTLQSELGALRWLAFAMMSAYY